MLMEFVAWVLIFGTIQLIGFSGATSFSDKAGRNSRFGTLIEHEEVSLSSDTDSKEPHIRIIGIGGFGGSDSSNRLEATRNKINGRFDKIDGIFLLGRNFKHGISEGIQDKKFEKFSRVLAAGPGVLSSTPHYVVIGDTDRKGSIDSLIEYSGVHDRWKFPSPFYFNRFKASNSQLDVCSWFLDTSKVGWSAEVFE
jgi:hypothetical protein